MLRTTEFAQGRTSRWGLAWSFAADPGGASKPLPRFPVARAATAAAAAAAGAQALERGSGGGHSAAAPQQRQPVQQAAAVPPLRPARQMGWQVQGAAAAGGDMLDAAAEALRAAGAEVTVDRATYTLRASYHPSEEERAAGAAAAAAAGRAAKRQRQQRQQQQQQQQAPEAAAGPWRAELQLFMQHAGAFALSAALDRRTPDAALGWWARAMGDTQAALAQRWSVAS